MRAAWVIAIVGCASAPAHPTYPAAKRGATVDAHGVPDPYRWLEAMESPETNAWVAAENALTDSVIHGLPTLDAFRTRITADHDVRVAPLHSYKFAAALQAAQIGSAPILLRIDTDSGHGGGNAVSQEIAQNAEILAFAAKYLDLK